MRTWSAVGAFAVLLSAWGAFRCWPRKLPPLLVRPPVPVVELTGTRTVVTVPGRVLVADVATFDDELFTYLMFGYLRSLVERDGCRTWMTWRRDDRGALAYVIRLEPPDNLATAIPYLLRLQADGDIEGFSYRLVAPPVIAGYQAQTHLFDSAYNLPARRKLERLPRAELVACLRRFIRFKAATDGRVRRRVEPIPRQPNRRQAHRLAEDIVTVADFYSLPLGSFLGIGAMENNYMNAPGDALNATWKRHAEKGDVILRRGRKGVLVANPSSGIWQITRESLRYAHRLFLKDKRDYSRLPEYLRPPKTLDLDHVPPEVLTTYAGLIFRNLLDRFHGNVMLAVGAYNGGPGNPNLKYESGVNMAAHHARTVTEHAAMLQGRPAAGMHFITSAVAARSAGRGSRATLP